MKISNRDWIQLSAYLDGELNPREVKRLEDRFKKEPDLQHALEELGLAKKILKAAPKLRTPRDFTLRPEMVGIKASPRPRSARAFRLASALMSFMLIGVLLLDFGRIFVGGAMAPAAPKEVMLEALPESAADAVEEPALMEAEVEDRAASETDAEPPAEEAAEAPAVAAEAGEEGESVGVVEEAEAKSAGEEDQDAEANQADEWQGEDSAQALAAPTQTIQIEIPETLPPQATEAVYFPAEPIQRNENMLGLDPFRILEIIFGLGAVAFGIAAWVIRRRNS